MTIDEAEQALPGLEEETFAVVAKCRLNVRAAPTRRSQVLDVVAAGAKLVAVAREDGWVRLEGSGYVAEELVA